MTVAEHPTPANYAAGFYKHIMAVRSRPSTRRTNTRRVSDIDHVPPNTDEPQQIHTLPALRSKRPRITSVSDHESLNKKPKHDTPIQQLPDRPLRIPLRSRHPPAELTVSVPPAPVLSNVSVSNTRRKLPHLKPPPIELSQDLDTSTGESTPRNEYDALIRDEKRARRAALAPNNDSKEKRQLRSHDGGSRSKSELAQYFQNYEQLISLDPTAPELITPKTIITFTDDLQEPLRETLAIKARASRPRPSFTSIPLHSAKRIDLSALAQSQRRPSIDPLSHELYFKAHRRPERQEKQLRNIEKERAQHEKVQLDRILEELKGPDWLKAMGISGITESEKKLYEPKRAYFIKEVTALINKFKHWKEEEKRRKAERDLAIAEALEEERQRENVSVDDDDTNESNKDGDEENADDGDADDEEIADSEEEHQDPLPKSSPTTSSDVDAQAALQLLQEASSATGRPTGKSRRQRNGYAPKPRRPRSEKATANSETDPPRTKHSTRPIHSFFANRGDSQPPSPQQPPSTTSPPTTPTRRRKKAQISRLVACTLREAVPDEMEEEEYDLPSGIRTEKRVRESRRKSRRLRRENGGKSRSVSH